MFRDLTVIKTTQSAFVNFVDDEYRTLPDAEDRIFSTIGNCSSLAYFLIYHADIDVLSTGYLRERLTCKVLKTTLLLLITLRKIAAVHKTLVNISVF